MIDAPPQTTSDLTGSRRPFLKSCALPLLSAFSYGSSISAAAYHSRQLALWLDTTGVGFQEQHRVVELALVEVLNGYISGNSLHTYLDPEREITAGAMSVHGVTTEIVTGMPRFNDVAERLSNFISASELIVVNPKFTIDYLNDELLRSGMPRAEQLALTIEATWHLAKSRWPTLKNDLDSVSVRLGVPITRRDALTTATQVAKTYLALKNSNASASSGEARVLPSQC